MITIDEYMYVQYQNKEIYNLIINKQSLYDKNFYTPMQNFFNQIYNFATCSQEGLYIWASILGVPVTYECKTDIPDSSALGFVTNTQNRANFSRGRLSGSTGATAISINEDLLRRAIILKGATMMSNYSTYSLNIACVLAFNGQVLDTNNMNVTYAMDHPADSNLILLAQNGYYFPRPSGVGLGSLIFNDSVYSGIYTYNGDIDYDN